MKALKFFILCCVVSFSFFVAACNDGGGGSSDTGTVAMSVTDAKPLLPKNVSNVFVTFSEVWVHKPGEGWIQLELVEPESGFASISAAGAPLSTQPLDSQMNVQVT